MHATDDQTEVAVGGKARYKSKKVQVRSIAAAPQMPLATALPAALRRGRGAGGDAGAAARSTHLAFMFCSRLPALTGPPARSVQRRGEQQRAAASHQQPRTPAPPVPMTIHPEDEDKNGRRTNEATLLARELLCPGTRSFCCGHHGCSVENSRASCVCRFLQLDVPSLAPTSSAGWRKRGPRRAPAALAATAAAATAAGALAAAAFAVWLTTDPGVEHPWH